MQKNSDRPYWALKKDCGSIRRQQRVLREELSYWNGSELEGGFWTFHTRNNQEVRSVHKWRLSARQQVQLVPKVPV